MDKNIVLTPIDLLGELFKLDRYDLESLPAYVERLSRLYARDTNASYKGLLWTLLVDMALPLIPYGYVDTTVPSSVAEISPSGMLLHNSIETISIPFFTHSSGYVEINESFISLKSTINGSATFSFGQEVKVVDSDYPRVQSELYNFPLKLVNLMFDKNTRYSYSRVSTEFGGGSLGHGNIVPGSVTCSDDELLMTERESAVSAVNYGDYFIDYSSGRVALPRTGKSKVSFIGCLYKEWPFKMYLTPVQIFKWIDTSLSRILYNVYNDVSNFERVPYYVAESIIDELRGLNVSY